MDEHPLITLLVKRMESHPEEFMAPVSRWESIIRDVNLHAKQADRERMQEKLSQVCMDKLHEVAMDELLNGDERRKQQELQKLEWEQRQLQKQAAHAHQMANVPANPYANQLNNYNQGLAGGTLSGMVTDQMNVAQGLLDEFRHSTGIFDVFDEASKVRPPTRRGLFGKRR